MKAQEVYDLTTKGGAGDFGRVVAICREVGEFCLIGGLAVNCYVEPVYTLDADFVVVADKAEELERRLRQAGFSVKTFPHSLNAESAESDLRVQFTTDFRYQDFPSRAQEQEVLGVRLPVAALEDVVRGKLWSYSDPERRLSKKKKDELDLLRLGEKFPELRSIYPPELRRMFE